MGAILKVLSVCLEWSWRKTGVTLRGALTFLSARELVSLQERLAGCPANWLAGWSASGQLPFNLPASPKLRRSNYKLQPGVRRPNELGLRLYFSLSHTNLCNDSWVVLLVRTGFYPQSQKFNNCSRILPVSLRYFGKWDPRKCVRTVVLQTVLTKRKCDKTFSHTQEQLYLSVWATVYGKRNLYNH